MIDIKVNQDNIRLQQKNLEKLLTTNPETREAIREQIRQIAWEARNATAHDIEDIIGNRGQTARAVRNVVYQKLLGFNVDIKNHVRRGSANWKVVQKHRKVEQNPHMRGGNRRKRSMRTIQIEGYEGKARGFILRWLNDGTRQRFIGVRNNVGTSLRAHIHYARVRDVGYGNRGRITAGNFFVQIAQKHIGLAANKLAVMIDEEINKIINN